MCGFVGFIDDLTQQEKSPVLKKMSDTIRHRGPDSEGFYIDDSIAMGFRRLSIIDLNSGDQPIYNEDKSYIITFNGEIYNFMELREILQSKGHHFATSCDTEVIIHGYEEWGEEMLPKLRGMFAFAIWDKANSELFCARDYFGIKPFYYGKSGDSFFYGSEIKAFLAHPSFDKQLNPSALKTYLTFQYSALEETFFKGIYRLRPGHFLRYKNGEIQVQQYFEVKYSPEKKSFANYEELLDETLASSVKYHQISDVEVGAFLSGGVDSSFIVSSARPAQTFSVGFGNNGYDESLMAKELSEMLGIGNNRELITADEFFDILPQIQYHTDEPHANLSTVPLYFLAKLAAKKVKVVLSGEGSDELFAGYIPFEQPLSTRLYGALPFPVKKAAYRAVRALPNFRGKYMMEQAAKRVEDYYIGQAFIMGDNDANEILNKTYRNTTSFRDVTAPVYAKIQGENDLIKKLYLDMHFWLPNDILLKADKMTMANSLELRVPFLDREVWELSRRIPMIYKVKGRITKHIFREVSRRKIPQEWANRKKLGFPVPFVIWSREEKYYKRIRETFSADYTAEFFEQDKILSLLDNHFEKTQNNGRKIYTIYSFLIWYKRYFIDI